MERDEVESAWRAGQAERWERASNYSEIIVIGTIVILGTLILWMLS